MVDAGAEAADSVLARIGVPVVDDTVLVWLLEGDECVLLTQCAVTKIPLVPLAACTFGSDCCESSPAAAAAATVAATAAMAWPVGSRRAGR